MDIAPWTPIRNLTVLLCQAFSWTSLGALLKWQVLIVRVGTWDKPWNLDILVVLVLFLVARALVRVVLVVLRRSHGCERIHVEYVQVVWGLVHVHFVTISVVIADDVASNAIQVVLWSTTISMVHLDVIHLVLSDWSVGILKDWRGFVLMEKSTFQHHNNSLVHVYSCLLDSFKEPHLSPLQLQ